MFMLDQVDMDANVPTHAIVKIYSIILNLPFIFRDGHFFPTNLHQLHHNILSTLQLPW